MINSKCSNRRFIVISLSLLFALNVQSQRYVLESVSGGRIEVTKKYDRLIDSCYVSSYKPSVDSLVKPVLGRSALYMDAKRPESLLSNWVADVIMEEMHIMGHSADFGLCNIGGLRSAMPEGNVTVGDVMSIAPFENRLCVVELRGCDVCDLFCQIAKAGGEGVSREVCMTIGPDGECVSLRIGGRKVKSDKTYSIATIDYLAEGNDGMSALKNSVSCTDTKILLRDALMADIRRQAMQGRPIKSKVEKRIVVIRER